MIMSEEFANIDVTYIATAIVRDIVLPLVGDPAAGYVRKMQQHIHEGIAEFSD